MSGMRSLMRKTAGVREGLRTQIAERREFAKLRNSDPTIGALPARIRSLDAFTRERTLASDIMQIDFKDKGAVHVFSTALGCLTGMACVAVPVQHDLQGLEWVLPVFAAVGTIGYAVAEGIASRPHNRWLGVADKVAGAAGTALLTAAAFMWTREIPTLDMVDSPAKEFVNFAQQFSTGVGSVIGAIWLSFKMRGLLQNERVYRAWKESMVFDRAAEALSTRGIAT